MEDLNLLAQRVREEVDRYEAPVSFDPRFGSTPTCEWVSRQLESMRLALIAPFSAQASDENGETRTVTVVADDGHGSVVVYDPDEEGDFALAVWTLSNLVLAGPKGDVVGCFLAR